MFEQVTPSVRVAKAGTGIGVVIRSERSERGWPTRGAEGAGPQDASSTHGERALLVDTGLDDNLVRKVVNALANEGVSVGAIVNTHAHADHIGGNAWAVKRTGAKVAAPAYEHYFVERPDREPYTLLGAAPPRSMSGSSSRPRRARWTTCSSPASARSKAST